MYNQNSMCIFMKVTKEKEPKETVNKTLKCKQVSIFRLPLTHTP